MIPISLSFEAFGPYVEKQYIDFAKLSQSGLFLIHGETGSGKTAILDALTYALYGKSSGGGRGDITEMRCQLADRQAITTVAYVFSVRGTTYKFIRTLKPIKKRNEEAVADYRTEQAAYTVDDMGIETLCVDKTGLREIEAKAESIIGLNYEQFRQVMILPQGQFEKLLVAKSDEKEQILVTLFNAEKWQLLAEWICDQARAMEKELQVKTTGIQAILESQGCKNLDDLRLKLEEKEAQRHDQQIEQERLRNLLSKEEKLLTEMTTIKGLFDSLEKEEQTYAFLLTEADQIRLLTEKAETTRRAEKLLPDWKSLETLINQLELRENAVIEAKVEAELARSILIKAKESVSNCQEKMPENLKNQQLLMKLEGLKQSYHKAALASTLAEQASKEYLAQQSLADAKSQQEKELIVRRNASFDLQQRIYTTYTMKLPGLRERYSALNNIKNLNADMKILKEKISAAELVAVKTIAVLEHHKKQLIELEEAHLKLNQSYLSNVAANLAQTLSDGDPCPVCGSIHHPEPRKFESEFGDLEELNRLSTQIDTVKKKVSELELSIEKERLQAEAFIRDLKDKNTTASEQEIIHHYSVENLEKVHQELSEAMSEDSKLIAIAQDLQHIDSEITEVRENIEILTAALSTAKAESDKSAAEYQALIGQLDHDISSESDLVTKIENLSSVVLEFNTKLDQAADELRKAELNTSSIETGLKLKIEELTKATDHYEKEKASFSASLTMLGFKDVESFRGAVLETANLASMERKINDYTINKQKSESKILELKAELKDGNKPDLEAQIQKTAELKKMKEVADADYAVTVSDTTRLGDLMLDIASRTSSLAGLKISFDKVQIFGKILRGDTGISLRRYVLGVMLTAITQEANRLLRSVHDGRYQLFRTLEGSGRNRKAGLDLEVSDSLSGERRSVSGLSGGEKFLVALALSLGLSTVVQAQSGGIRLDAIFIDEGFGSLDPNSIQDALGILASVKGSRRLVGMISHVQMLKENIETSIEVKKGKKGSTLVINA